MKRILPLAAWLALALVAVQAAALAHDHADPAAPSGAASQVCDFCVGVAAAAPAPEQAGLAPPAPDTQLAAADFGPVPPRSHPARSGPCRAPPSRRSS